MAWRHRVAIVVLLAVTGLPVAGAVCALACESAATHGTAHHGPDQECEQPSGAPSGPGLSGLEGHDCGTHDAAMRLAATTAAERADLSARSAPALVYMTSLGEFETLSRGRESVDHAAPPGTAPPTIRPAVLRI